MDGPLGEKISLNNVGFHLDNFFTHMTMPNFSSAGIDLLPAYLTVFKNLIFLEIICTLQVRKGRKKKHKSCSHSMATANLNKVKTW